MEEYTVDLLPEELLGWIREDAAKRTPRFDVRISKEWNTEADFDREAFGIGEDDDLELVSVNGVMEISPRRGRGGWKLILRAEDVVGLLPDPGYEDYEDEDDLTLEAFEQQFLEPEKGEVELVVAVWDREGWTRFRRWLARRRAGARKD